LCLAVAFAAVGFQAYYGVSRTRPGNRLFTLSQIMRLTVLKLLSFCSILPIFKKPKMCKLFFPTPKPRTSAAFAASCPKNGLMFDTNREKFIVLVLRSRQTNSSSRCDVIVACGKHRNKFWKEAAGLISALKGKSRFIRSTTLNKRFGFAHFLKQTADVYWKKCNKFDAGMINDHEKLHGTWWKYIWLDRSTKLPNNRRSAYYAKACLLYASSLPWKWRTEVFLTLTAAGLRNNALRQYLNKLAGRDRTS